MKTTKTVATCTCTCDVCREQITETVNTTLVVRRTIRVCIVERDGKELDLCEKCARKLLQKAQSRTRFNKNPLPPPQAPCEPFSQVIHLRTPLSFTSLVLACCKKC
jgi:hypothetical protein